MAFSEENKHTASRDIYTVSRLNGEIKTLLEEHFLSIWIDGELSNFVQPHSGHMYFSLKDANAQVRCAMFRSNNRKLRFTPEDGLQVLARVRPSLYSPRGDYQLIVESMDVVGDGLLRLEFERLYQRLAKEGMFADEHKKSIPKLPHCVGLITSPTGAAIHDALTVLRRRFAPIDVIVYPTLVQGDQAAQQIVHAIKLANRQQACDVLLLIRGGGSLEDLWPFNEENVAKAIYQSKIPLVSGIGHEIDFTIADFVADLRAPTPSGAAEIVSPDQDEWLATLNQYAQRLITSMLQVIKNAQARLTSYHYRIQHPSQRIQLYAQRCDDLEARLIRHMHNVLRHQQNKLSGYMRALEAMSPLSTLARGYAIVQTLDEKIIDNTKSVHVGDNVTATLNHGKLLCTVDKKLS